MFRCAMSPDVGGLEYGQEEALRQGVCHVPLPQPAVELHGIQLTPGPDGQGGGSVRDGSPVCGGANRGFAPGAGHDPPGRCAASRASGDVVILFALPAAAPAYTAEPWRPGDSRGGGDGGQRVGHR